MKLIEQCEQAFKKGQMISLLCEQPQPAQPLANKVTAASIQQKTPACLQKKNHTTSLPSSESMQNDVIGPQLQFPEKDPLVHHNAPLQPQKCAIHIPSNENISQPPAFQSAMAHMPPKLNTAFKAILHGEMVGIWPIRDDCLK